MVMHAYLTPMQQGAEKGQSLGLSGFLPSSRFSERPRLKGGKKSYLTSSSGICMHTHAPMFIYATYSHTGAHVYNILVLVIFVGKDS